MNDKKIMITFAKWLKTRKKDSLPKEWVNIPDEQLAEEIASFLQTEDGIKQLAPFIKEFETDMQQQHMMFAEGGNFLYKASNHNYDNIFNKRNDTYIEQTDHLFDDSNPYRVGIKEIIPEDSLYNIKNLKWKFERKRPLYTPHPHEEVQVPINKLYRRV